MFPEWLTRLIGGRSLVMANEANRCLQEAQRLQKAGRQGEALAVAQAGLQLLRAPGVKRRRPAESTVLISLTTFVEDRAAELGVAGAARQDLEDTLSLLTGLTSASERFPDLAARRPPSVAHLVDKWVPYLQRRLTNGDH